MTHNNEYRSLTLIGQETGGGGSPEKRGERGQEKRGAQED